MVTIAEKTAEPVKQVLANLMTGNLDAGLEGLQQINDIIAGVDDDE